MPGSSVLSQSIISQSLLKFMSTESVMDLTISSSAAHFCCPFAFNLSQHQSFPMSWLFTSNGQSIRASASAAVIPVIIQDWFPLGLSDFDLLVAQETLKFSPAPQFESINFKAPKHQFFGAQSSLWSSFMMSLLFKTKDI